MCPPLGALAGLVALTACVSARAVDRSSAFLVPRASPYETTASAGTVAIQSYYGRYQTIADYAAECPSVASCQQLTQSFSDVCGLDLQSIAESCYNECFRDKDLPQDASSSYNTNQVIDQLGFSCGTWNICIKAKASVPAPTASNPYAYSVGWSSTPIACRPPPEPRPNITGLEGCAPFAAAAASATVPKPYICLVTGYPPSSFFCGDSCTAVVSILKQDNPCHPDLLPVAQTCVCGTCNDVGGYWSMTPSNPTEFASSMSAYCDSIGIDLKTGERYKMDPAAPAAGPARQPAPAVASGPSSQPSSSAPAQGAPSSGTTSPSSAAPPLLTSTASNGAPVTLSPSAVTVTSNGTVILSTSYLPVASRPSADVGEIATESGRQAQTAYAEPTQQAGGAGHRSVPLGVWGGLLALAAGMIVLV